jgi:DNA-binding GntR family transcriptional regulator
VLPRFLLEGCGEIADQLAQGSIYHLLADLQVTVKQGIATIIPARADSMLATALRIRRGTMLVYLRQVDYMADGRPVMLSHEHHLASAFEITVRRKGPAL